MATRLDGEKAQHIHSERELKMFRVERQKWDHDPGLLRSTFGRHLGSLLAHIINLNGGNPGDNRIIIEMVRAGTDFVSIGAVLSFFTPKAKTMWIGGKNKEKGGKNIKYFGIHNHDMLASKSIKDVFMEIEEQMALVKDPNDLLVKMMDALSTEAHMSNEHRTGKRECMSWAKKLS